MNLELCHIFKRRVYLREILYYLVCRFEIINKYNLQYLTQVNHQLYFPVEKNIFYVLVTIVFVGVTEVI